MIKIENTEVMGWEAAIRGMRNPMNSWERSDSGYCLNTLACHDCKWNRTTEVNCKNNIESHAFVVGKNDLDLMTRLRNAGTDHRKFMRMITVYVDITAPLYWWKEFDTYKVGTVANSCSTMHKIQDHILSLEDFSCEHLSAHSIELLDAQIIEINKAILYFREHNDKEDWWQIIQLLPSSYNQTRNVMMNYEVLANIYKSRKNHKLDCWRDFCEWIEELPYSELICDIKED